MPTLTKDDYHKRLEYIDEKYQVEGLTIYGHWTTLIEDMIEKKIDLNNVEKYIKENDLIGELNFW